MSCVTRRETKNAESFLWINYDQAKDQVVKRMPSEVAFAIHQGRPTVNSIKGNGLSLARKGSSQEDKRVQSIGRAQRLDLLGSDMLLDATSNLRHVRA